MHGDISKELEALGESEQEAFDLWQHSFNYERPHEALGMRTPGEVYVVSERKYEGTPKDLEYPQMCTRRVNPTGLISLNGESVFLSASLAGWSVGLKPIAADLMEVWFGRLLLGQVDLRASSFIRADSRLDKVQKVAAICPNKTAKEPNKE
jgi:hypothetical protein